VNRAERSLGASALMDRRPPSEMSESFRPLVLFRSACPLRCHRSIPSNRSFQQSGDLVRTLEERCGSGLACSSGRGVFRQAGREEEQGNAARDREDRLPILDKVSHEAGGDHHGNDSAHRIGPVCCRGIPEVAAQQKLGVLPKRGAGPGSSDPPRLGLDWALLRREHNDTERERPAREGRMFRVFGRGAAPRAKREPPQSRARRD
jgi:hypothetical protein